MENKNQLNCTKLYECMEVKNYKIMCELLNQEVTNGNSKKYQIKNWNRYFDYTKQGQKFIINEIFDKPFPTVDMRAQGSIRKHYKEFQIENGGNFTALWIADKNT